MSGIFLRVNQTFDGSAATEFCFSMSRLYGMLYISVMIECQQFFGVMCVENVDIPFI